MQKNNRLCNMNSNRGNKKKMLMNKKRYGGMLFGSTMMTVVVIGIISGMFILTSVLSPEVMRSWRPVRADGNPGAGASGMVNLFIYPHSAVPGTTYATNLTTGNAYAHRNTWNGSMTGEVPYDTEFDIVVKARFNTTHAWNLTTPGWDMDYVKALITCADLGIGADTEMTAVQTASSATFVWVQFYVNNADAGYTVSHGVTTNVTSVKLQAFY